MNLDVANPLADAVLLEGYALYPFRSSAIKNRYRWTFGVLAPRAWSEAGGCERWWFEAQLLVAYLPRTIAGRLRMFRIERRSGWDEGVLEVVDFDVERGDVAFERAGVTGRIVVTRVRVDDELEQVAIRVENTTPWTHLAAPRSEVIAAAFASTHLIVGVDGGELLSVIDPPAAAPQCRSVGTFPVLVARDVALCAPFAMPDFPSVAPESTGDFCDATEIDELLALRTRLLTDDEKREARVDPRIAAIVDRAAALDADAFARMHGATRDVRAGEMTPRFRPGSKVRIVRSPRRTDAQDLVYTGRIATVAELRHDVDGSVFLAVTIDDDPAAELLRWHQRFHYFSPEEIEPVPS